MLAIKEVLKIINQYKNKHKLKTQLENLQADFETLKAQVRLFESKFDSLLDRYHELPLQPEPEPLKKFVKGRVYKSMVNSLIFMVFKEIGHNVGFRRGVWGKNINVKEPKYWQEATHEEWHELIKAEAVKRGFVDGVEFKAQAGNSYVLEYPLLQGAANRFNLKDSQDIIIFNADTSKWSEVINEDIMIGDDKVIFENGHTKINGVWYDKKFWHSALEASLYLNANVALNGCVIPSETIKKILDRL